MKTIHILLLLCCFLASCQMPPDTAASITTTLDRVAQTLDRDANGVITNPEVRGATNPNDPMNWMNLIGIVLGGLGIGWAGAARSKATIAQAQVDDLYDATHAPIAKPA